MLAAKPPKQGCAAFPNLSVPAGLKCWNSADVECKDRKATSYGKKHSEAQRSTGANTEWETNPVSSYRFLQHAADSNKSKSSKYLKRSERVFWSQQTPVEGSQVLIRQNMIPCNKRTSLTDLLTQQTTKWKKFWLKKRPK